MANYIAINVELKSLWLVKKPMPEGVIAGWTITNLLTATSATIVMICGGKTGHVERQNAQFPGGAKNTVVAGGFQRIFTFIPMMRLITRREKRMLTTLKIGGVHGRD